MIFNDVPSRSSNVTKENLRLCPRSDEPVAGARLAGRRFLAAAAISGSASRLMMSSLTISME
jgi:hypothetical protein